MIAPRRIAVIGLFPSQIAHVRRVTPDGVDLLTIDKDAVNLPTASLVIVMAKFISHWHVEKCIAAYGRERVTLCHGGLSSLKKLLKAGEQ